MQMETFTADNNQIISVRVSKRTERDRQGQREMDRLINRKTETERATYRRPETDREQAKDRDTKRDRWMERGEKTE